MSLSPHTASSKAGDTLPGFRRLVTQERVEQYADAAGDHNPIHLDPQFAEKSQFGKRIAHGMLSLAFVAEMLALAYPGTWHRSGKLKVRFTSPVYPGETVETYGEVTSVRQLADGAVAECVVGCRRPDGSDAVTGRASVRLPG